MGSPLITLITPGGGRPEAFALCEKYIKRQTVWGPGDKHIPIQWIVADDNKADPVKCTMNQEHVFGALPWKPGINTLRYNLAAALPLVRGDYVFIIENDDYYAPKYLEVYCDMLKYADLVGGADVTYYNVAVKGFKEMGNFKHSSTCQTAFRKSYLPWFEQAIHSGEQFFDILLWNKARLKHHKWLLLSGTNLCVGMKGVGGRAGIGFGHTNAHEFTADNHFVKLRELIGAEDAQVYERMVK